MIDISSIREIRLEQDSGKGRFGFYVLTLRRDYLFGATTLNERTEWISALKSSLEDEVPVLEATEPPAPAANSSSSDREMTESGSLSSFVTAMPGTSSGSLPKPFAKIGRRTATASQSAAFLPLSPIPPIQGFLWKGQGKDPKKLRGWQKRWVSLKDGLLSYGNSKDEVSRVVSLETIQEITEVFFPSTRGRCVFIVTTSLRPFILAAPTPAERAKWIDSLRERVVASILPGLSLQPMAEEEEPATEELRDTLKSVLPETGSPSLKHDLGKLPLPPPPGTGSLSGSASPLSDSPRKKDVLCEGWLHKGNGKDRRKPGGWQKRWFVLKATGLSYGVSKNVSKGSIPIETVREVQLGEASRTKKRYIFMLNTTARIFFLYASKEEEREQWIKNIKSALGLQTVVPKMPEEGTDEAAIDPADEKYYSTIPYNKADGFLLVPEHEFIGSGDMPISILNVFKYFYSDESLPFLQAFHVKRGDQELKVDNWYQHATFGNYREVSYRAPVKAALGPKSTMAVECQRYNLQKDTLVYEQHLSLREVPYGDTFRVESRWEYKATGPNSCKYQHHVGLHWFKSPFVKKIITSQTLKECREAFDNYLALVNEEMKSKPQLQQPNRSPSQPRSNTESNLPAAPLVMTSNAPSTDANAPQLLFGVQVEKLVFMLISLVVVLLSILVFQIVRGH